MITAYFNEEHQLVESKKTKGGGLCFNEEYTKSKKIGLSSTELQLEIQRAEQMLLQMKHEQEAVDLVVVDKQARCDELSQGI